MSNNRSDGSRRVSVGPLVGLAILLALLAVNFVSSFGPTELSRAAPYFFILGTVTALGVVATLWLTGRIETFFEPMDSLSRFGWLALIPGLAALAAFVGRQSPELQFSFLGICAGVAAGMLLSWGVGSLRRRRRGSDPPHRDER